MNQKSCSDKKANHAVLVIAGSLLSTLPFWFQIFSGYVLAGRDLSHLLMPAKNIWAHSMKQFGHVPYWDHFSQGGTPYLAEAAHMPLHPLNFIFLLFESEDLPLAMTIFVLLHFPLLFLAGYCFLRSLALNMQFSVVFSLFLCWSGIVISSTNLILVIPEIVASLLYAGAIAKYLKAPSMPLACLAGIALGLSVFFADLQYTIILILVSGCFLVFVRPKLKILLFRDIALVAICAFCFSAWQLLPYAEHALNSARLYPDLESSLRASFHPLRWLELVLPNFVGDRVGFADFWIKEFMNASDLYIYSVYLGTPLFLSSTATIYFLWTKGRNWSVTVFNKLNVFWGFSFLFLCAACMGIYSPIPLYEWLYETLPLWDKFRYPERLVVWPCLLLWALSAISCSTFLDKHKEYQSLPFRVHVLLNTAWIAPILFFFVLFSNLVLENSAAQSAFVKLLLFWTLLSVVNVLWQTKVINSRSAISLFLLICCFDLLSTAQSTIWSVDPKLFNKENYVVIDRLDTAILADTDYHRGGGARRISTSTLSLLKSKTLTSSRLNSLERTIVTSIEGMSALNSNLWGWESIDGHYAFISKEILSLREQFSTRIHTFLDLTGVRYSLHRNRIYEPVVELNNDVIPYFSIQSEWHVAENTESIWRYWKERKLNEASLVILQQDQVISHESQPNQQLNIQIDLKKRDGREIVIEVESETEVKSAAILLLETFNPGWKLFVKEKRVPIIQANGWAIAAFLPTIPAKTPTLLRFRYAPSSITIGKTITCLFLVILFFAFAWLGFKKLLLNK